MATSKKTPTDNPQNAIVTTNDRGLSPALSGIQSLSNPEDVNHVIALLDQFIQEDHTEDVLKEGRRAVDYLISSTKAMNLEKQLMKALHQSILLAHKFGSQAEDKRFGNVSSEVPENEKQTPKEMKDRSNCRKLARYPLDDVERISKELILKGKHPSVGIILARLKTDKPASKTEDQKKEAHFNALLRLFRMFKADPTVPTSIFNYIGGIMKYIQVNDKLIDPETGAEVTVDQLVKSATANRPKAKRGRKKKPTGEQSSSNGAGQTGQSPSD